LKILSEHKGNDLGLFDRIMAWVCHFSDKYPSIWKTRKLYAHRKRKTILRYLAKYFRMDDLYPEPVTVECEKGKVTVPVFDFEKQLLSIVCDDELMSDENLLQEFFDKDTLRPTLRAQELKPTDVIDDINTGELYWRGIEQFCDSEVPPDADLIVACSIRGRGEVRQEGCSVTRRRRVLRRLVQAGGESDGLFDPDDWIPAEPRRWKREKSR